MTKTIDACGLACPAPVLLIKDTIEQNIEKELIVIVDNEASKENVSRFLGAKGYQVTTSKSGDNFEIAGVLNAAIQPAPVPTGKKDASPEDRQKILVMIASDRLGSGDDTLGSKLMISYIKTIKEMGDSLWHLIFVNSGVNLTIQSSPVLAEIQEYEKAGVIVLVCGTCLDFFGLTSEKKVGGTTNMLDIITATELADKVITIG